jgi:hypothetical protein
MKQFEAEYYEVYESYDRDYTPVAKFSNYSDALAYSKKSVYMNVDSKPRRMSVIIFDSLDEVEAIKEISIKRRALEKLTEEERKALGL